MAPAARALRLNARMRRLVRPGHTLVIRATVALLLLVPLGALAQDVTAAALKAAYIYNFAKFTTWSAAVPATQPLVMCVLGDAAVGDALERAIVGRVLDGHRLVTSLMVATGPRRTCHILYVSGVTASQAGELVADLRDSPVLTISDVEGFTGVGGIAQLFFDRGQLRFRINLESAKRAGVQISSRLLIMARPE